MTDEPKRKRKWLQFSLRGFVFFCAVVCIWLGLWINAAREQAKVVEWVRENGGRVLYENEKKQFHNVYTWHAELDQKWRWFPKPKSIWYPYRSNSGDY